MKNIRVVLVPTETGNSIDQMSDIKDVLACEDATIWELSDFFQACNDEEISVETNWTFLIDIEKNEFV